MNPMKRFVSILLALILLCSTATVAFAAGEGSITVENPKDGQDYIAYKIFDVEYNADNTAYTYTIAADSEWLSAVQAYEGVSLSTLMTDADGNGFYTVSTNDSFSAAAFAAVLKATVEGKTGVALTIADGKATATGLDLGYYFVTSSTGALCNLTTIDPSASIRDKNDVPFDKTADDESVEVGQVVNYTITAKVPDTTGFTTYVYEIQDQMSAGLTFGKDVAVTVGGASVTVQPDYDSISNGFKLSLDVMSMTAGDEIVVTYSATVNENAVAKIETNKATLTYSNDPTDSTKTTTTPDDVVKVYTAKIIIDKYAAGDEADKLAGAQFVLMNAEGKFYKYENEDVSWVDAQADATVVTTDANGAAEFKGLENGAYSLKEIEAPAGYNLLGEAIPVTVNGNADSETSLTVTAQVANNSGAELPETGGMGTTVLYTVGGLLVAAAVVLLIAKKRMGASK